MQHAVVQLGGGFTDNKKNRIITVQDIPITISVSDMDDYICITDIAAAKGGNSRAADVVKNWIRNRMTLEFASAIIAGVEMAICALLCFFRQTPDAINFALHEWKFFKKIRRTYI